MGLLQMRCFTRVASHGVLTISCEVQASAVCGFVFIMVGEFNWSDVKGSPLTIVAILLSSVSLLFTVGVFVAIKFTAIFVRFHGEQSSSRWSWCWDYCHWNTASVCVVIGGSRLDLRLSCSHIFSPHASILHVVF